MSVFSDTTVGTNTFAVPQNNYVRSILIIGPGGGGAGGGNSAGQNGSGGGAGGAILWSGHIDYPSVITYTTTAGGAFGVAATSSTSATSGSPGTGTAVATCPGFFTLTCNPGLGGAATIGGYQGGAGGTATSAITAGKATVFKGSSGGAGGGSKGAGGTAGESDKFAGSGGRGGFDTPDGGPNNAAAGIQAGIKITYFKTSSFFLGFEG